MYHSEATVPGSGSDGFPVDNGRGQLRLKIEPGDYRVIVQDHDSGVRDFYTESEVFSVKGICTVCMIIIMLKNLFSLSSLQFATAKLVCNYRNMFTLSCIL